MPGQHRPGYHADYQKAQRIILARFRKEIPNTYQQWLDEALRQIEREKSQ